MSIADVEHSKRSAARDEPEPARARLLARSASSVYARAPMSAALLRWLACSSLLLTVACAPQIGKHCGNSLDCSAQGSRICDRTQPAGYCTIMGCEEGTCPSEAVCVKFRPKEERLAVTYCMAKCDERSDCRDSEGYHCTSTKDFGQGSDAEILGDSSQRFCAIAAAERVTTWLDAISGLLHKSIEPQAKSNDAGGDESDAAAP